MRCLPALHLSPHLRTTSFHPGCAHTPSPRRGGLHRQVSSCSPVPVSNEGAHWKCLCQVSPPARAETHPRPPGCSRAVPAPQNPRGAVPGQSTLCCGHCIPELSQPHGWAVTSGAALCARSRGFTHRASCDVTALS